MSDKHFSFTEPTAIACPVCTAGIAEWCLQDDRNRKWIAGAPVHQERIDAVNRAYPPRTYPRQNGSIWDLYTSLPYSLKNHNHARKWRGILRPSELEPSPHESDLLRLRQNDVMEPTCIRPSRNKENC